MPLVQQEPGVPNETSLKVAILGHDKQSRMAVVEELSRYSGLQLEELSLFPPNREDLTHSLAQNHDVVIIEVDRNPDSAFEMAVSLCAEGRTYVMAYSTTADMKMAVHLMRAGIREFFTLPLDPAEVSAALTRASAYLAASTPEETATGKLFVFLGTKGGCGVTTLAANFALATAQESARETLLIDLGQPLGDAAINLGIVSEYSVAAALQHPGRLDANFLSNLTVKHSSGLSVLAASNDFPENPPSQSAIDKLVSVARSAFDYVVVDIGSRVDLMRSSLFADSATVYLISQVGISELLTANRMITKFFAARHENLQIVLNRYKSSDLLFDDSQIVKALTRPAQWKIPDDYAAARRKRETSTPMVMVDSAISEAIRQMAKTAAGLLPEKNGKKGFFSFLR